MTAINQDTTHVETWTANEFLTEFISEQTDEGTSGTSGTNGASGTSGTSGTSGAAGYTITDISDTYTGLTSDIFIRASGISYTVYIPTATGSGKQLIVKSLASGTITVAPLSGLIDGVVSKDITSTYSSFTLVDAEVGSWNLI